MNYLHKIPDDTCIGVSSADDNLFGCGTLVVIPKEDIRYFDPISDPKTITYHDHNENSLGEDTTFEFFDYLIIPLNINTLKLHQPPF